jgi:aspartate racemase
VGKSLIKNNHQKSKQRLTMKTIGLIGGMSWESSLEYYRLINQLIREKLGGFNSAKCIMVSINFSEIEQQQRNGDWEGAARILIDAARIIENAGGDFLLICTNTMHLLADQVQRAVTIPLVHIADPTAQAVIDRGMTDIGLLGTKFTMQEDFYKGRLEEMFNLKVLIPDEADMEIVHNVIYDELVSGVLKLESKEAYLRIMNKLAEHGAQGIILGCTEIGQLVNQEDTPIPLFDTTWIHAQAAVNYALDASEN